MLNARIPRPHQQPLVATASCFHHVCYEHFALSVERPINRRRTMSSYSYPTGSSDVGIIVDIDKMRRATV